MSSDSSREARPGSDAGTDRPTDSHGGATATAWARPAESAEPPNPRRWLIWGVVLCPNIMNQIDTTIVNVAAPSVQAEIGGGNSTLQWLAAGYTLAFAVFLITGGRLGDIYGRRTMFLVGAAGFTAASVACGLAGSPGTLIAARVLQGAFGALLIPQGMGILKTVFPQRELGTAFGLFAPIMGLASVSGPILGGALIDADIFGTGWRMVFLVNLPIGLIALAGAVFLLPRKQDKLNMRLDLIGASIVTAAAVLVIYPLVQGRAHGWPVWIWVMLASGVVAFGLFAVYERHTTRAPIIEPSLLRNRVFISGLAIAIVFFGAVAGVVLVITLYLQIGLHFTPVHAALTGIPLSLGIAGAGLVATKLTARFGRHILHGGLAVMIIGLIALAVTVDHYGSTITSWLLVPAHLLIGAGMGVIFGPLFRVVLGGVSQREVGSASGTLSAVQQFGGSLGVGVIATIYFTLTANPADLTSGMVTTALIVASVAAVAFGLVFLLPNKKLASW